LASKLIKIDWAGRTWGKTVSLEINYKASLPYFYNFQKSSRKIPEKGTAPWSIRQNWKCQ
jgi:hypothetical protein